MNDKILNSNDMYTVEVDCVNDAQWSDTLNSFEDATIYQTFAYGTVRWGSKNLSHIVLKNGESVVAAAQLVIKKIPFVRLGVAYAPWGPVWRVKDGEKNKAYLEQILKALINEYALKRGLLLQCSPPDIAGEDDEIVSIYRNAGFNKDLRVNPYRTFIIDMTRSIEELRTGLDSKWRNQLNKALKNDLEVSEGSSDSDYKVFLDLQREMQDRKKYTPGVDYDEFRDILNQLPDSQKMKIYICSHEGVPVAATIISLIGKRGIYLLGATANSGMQLNGSNLLQWRIIEWLKNQGCSCYDLGGIDPENNPGVYHFKNRLAGKNGEEFFHIGQYSISGNFLNYPVFGVVTALRGIVNRIMK